MAAGGLSLSQLLAVDAQAGVGRSHKAVINVYLPGGPSHLDLFDLKPKCPRRFVVSCADPDKRVGHGDQPGVSTTGHGRG